MKPKKKSVKTKGPTLQEQINGLQRNAQGEAEKIASHTGELGTLGVRVAGITSRTSRTENWCGRLGERIGILEAGPIVGVVEKRFAGIEKSLANVDATAPIRRSLDAIDKSISLLGGRIDAIERPDNGKESTASMRWKDHVDGRLQELQNAKFDQQEFLSSIHDHDERIRENQKVAANFHQAITAVNIASQERDRLIGERMNLIEARIGRTESKLTAAVAAMESLVSAMKA